MQGSWTISVKQKSASWAQRFKIDGSTNGADDVYDGDTTTPPIFVTGDQWGLTIEHNPAGPISWTRSRFRLKNFHVSGGQFQFDIQSDDTAGDLDFNDLIITCSMALAPSEYVVYGRVKSYSGLCLFNPCYPRTFYVVDTLAKLKKLLEYPSARSVIEKLYPKQVKQLLKKPFPEPDPAPFKPMMIPSGLPDEAGLSVNWNHRAINTKSKKLEENKKQGNDAYVQLVNEKAYYARDIAVADLHEMTRLVDLVFQRCSVKTLTETLLRFIEYDRTAAEKLGDPYTGEGNRTELGIASTDELGYYVFRFSQTIPEIVDEGSDIAIGEDLLQEIRPDLLIQLMESLPDGVAYETAPYYNIPNIKRIDLCIPESMLKPPMACQGGRAIQAIGNIFTVPNPGTTLHSDGTVTNASSIGPNVNHAAWYGKLDLFACFLDTTPAVKYYTLSYKRAGEDWHWVGETYKHLQKQTNGTWKWEKVGPDTRDLRVDSPTDPKVNVDSYMNIESDSDWLYTHRNRKIILSSWIYTTEPGSVEFKIVGYDKDHEKVPGAVDTIKLYIDNKLSTGDIESIKLGSIDPGECAYFTLPTEGSPLTVKYRVTDEEGFMAEYALNVYRGSNTHVPTQEAGTTSPVAYQYQAVSPYSYRGTLDQGCDSEGYIEIPVEPSSGAWLPSGINFCAFDFELSARDRLTNGYSTPSNRILWRELVGIEYTPPETS